MKIDTSNANYKNAGLNRSTSVGKYENGKSQSGCYDMGGNVWEWGSDWYAKYSAFDAKNLQGDSGSGYKVARGGSFTSRSVLCNGYHTLCLFFYILYHFRVLKCAL